MLELEYALAVSCAAISGPGGDGIVLIICIICSRQGSEGLLRSNAESPARVRCERGLMSRTLKSNKWKYGKKNARIFSLEKIGKEIYGE